MRVIGYDSRWLGLFKAASDELSAALGQAVSQNHHVGSTAIPGMPAKPVLDILACNSDFRRTLDLVPVLADLGYEHRPNDDIPDRHFFRRRLCGIRTHHLSIVEASSRYSIFTLAFRDALRADRQLAMDYSKLKLELAQRFPRDRES